MASPFWSSYNNGETFIKIEEEKRNEKKVLTGFLVFKNNNNNNNNNSNKKAHTLAGDISIGYLYNTEAKWRSTTRSTKESFQEVFPRSLWTYT